MITARVGITGSGRVVRAGTERTGTTAMTGTARTPENGRKEKDGMKTKKERTGTITAGIVVVGTTAFPIARVGMAKTTKVAKAGMIQTLRSERTCKA